MTEVKVDLLLANLEECLAQESINNDSLFHLLATLYDTFFPEILHRPQFYVKFMFSLDAKRADVLVNLMASLVHIDRYLELEAKAIELAARLISNLGRFEEFCLLFKAHLSYTLHIATILSLQCRKELLPYLLPTLYTCNGKVLESCEQAFEAICTIIMDASIEDTHELESLFYLLTNEPILIGMLSEHPACPFFLSRLLRLSTVKDERTMLVMTAVIMSISDNAKTIGDESVEKLIHLALSLVTGLQAAEAKMLLTVMASLPRAGPILSRILKQGYYKLLAGLWKIYNQQELKKTCELFGALIEFEVIDTETANRVIKFEEITKWLNGFGLEPIWMLRLCSKLVRGGLALEASLLEECLQCIFKMDNRIGSTIKDFSISLHSVKLSADFLKASKLTSLEGTIEKHYNHCLSVVMKRGWHTSLERLELCRSLVLLAYYFRMPWNLVVAEACSYIIAICESEFIRTKAIELSNCFEASHTVHAIDYYQEYSRKRLIELNLVEENYRNLSLLRNVSQDNDQLKIELEAATVTVAKLESELSSRNASLDELNKSAESLQADYQTVIEERARLQEQLEKAEELQNQLGYLTIEVSAKTNQIVELETKLATVQEDRDELFAALEANRIQSLGYQQTIKEETATSKELLERATLLNLQAEREIKELNERLISASIEKENISAENQQLIQENHGLLLKAHKLELSVEHKDALLRGFRSKLDKALLDDNFESENIDANTMLDSLS